MLRGCPCNASTTTRTETNVRTLSNTVFANGELPPTPEARHLSALAVAVAQFVLNDMVKPRTAPGADYEQLVLYPDPFFTPTPINMSIPNWTTVPSGCPNPYSDTTPYLDLSNVYGVNPAFLTGTLRAQQGGMLAVQPGNQLLPYPYDGAPFVMADARDGVTGALAALQTLMVRNHNSWATRITHLRPDWQDEQLFWKARQLNIAEWQHMLFHEWLPAVLGSLAPTRQSTLTEYNPALPSAVRVEVAAVMMPALVDTLTPANYGDISWTQQYGVDTVASLIQAEGIEPMLVRLLQTPALAFDARVSNALRNIYNASEPVDYVSWNVQRARVLRIPDWAAMYTCFGTVPIAGDSRDAYQGFLQEAIYPGSSEGLTGGSLLASEFGRLRDADPNFYSFQRAAIGKLLWPDIVKSNMRDILLRNAGFPASFQIEKPFFVQ
jgi:hypothetical protein